MSTINIFAKEMDDIALEVERNTLKITRRVSLDVVQYLAYTTPQLSGQASGNWKTTVGSPASDWDEGPSNPNVSISAARAALATLGKDQEVYIANNVPYIERLNEGYSGKAPVGFVEAAELVGLDSIERLKLLGW